MKKLLTFAAILSLPFLLGAGTVVKTLDPSGQLGPSVVSLPKITLPTCTGSNTGCTTVVNRAKMTDFANDLMPKFGVDRIQTQQIMRVMDEQGLSGQPVWKAVNDIHDQIRFVGSWSSAPGDVSGPLLTTATTDDYVEVTFYGTGLNVLYQRQGSQPLFYPTVDGGTETASSVVTATSTVLNNRNYAANIVGVAASGLTAGMHTVKLRLASSIAVIIYGFEIINSSSPTNITLSPGSSYVNGQKLTKSASSTTAYNSGFESGTLGTRGGHVLVYQKSDGSVAKAVTPTDAAPAYLANANHANEEIVRTYNWREFGAGYGFSTLAASAGNVAFTLDDGTTSLVGNLVVATSINHLANNSASSFFTITFVGSGIDIASSTPSTTIDSHTFYIDGSSVGSLTSQTVGTTKIASGLAYGTHTLKVARTAIASNSFTVNDFIVYAPKTPTLPVGANALADYFVMADYVAGTGSYPNQGTLSQGVLVKPATREVGYIGVGVGWTAVSSNSNAIGGFYVGAVGNNSTASLTFFGTGVEVYNSSFVVYPQTVTVKIDGVSYAGAATATNGNSWAAPTWTMSNAGQLQITGLTSGTHTIELTFTNAATAGTALIGFGVITPIHAPKLNGPFVVQNTLSIGSQSIRDLRQFSVAQGGQQKMVAQAVGIAAASTTSTSAVPLANMSQTIKTTGGPIQITYSITARNSNLGYHVYTQAYVDGVAVGSLRDTQAAGADYANTQADALIVPVSAGIHKIDVYWNVNAFTGNASQTWRTLVVREL